MTRIRAFPNPEFERKSVDDPIARAPSAYDRVDALAYLSKHVRSKMAQLVARAATLLGPDLRCPELLLPLIDSSGHELRVGLAGLALLGDPRAELKAYEMLEDPRVSLEEVETAVWTLMLLRALRVEKLPQHLRRPERRMVFNLVREAVRAADLGRWLY